MAEITVTDITGLSGHMPRRHVRTGRLRAVFEPDSGALRELRMGGTELVRLVHACVRDERWNTLPVAIRDVQLTETQDAFEIRFDAQSIVGPIDFTWQSVIRGTSAGRLSYTFSGTARSDFLRNRIGLCVLLPQELAGRPCEVRRTGGQTIAGHLPQPVSPHQPFLDMQAISIGGADGARVAIELNGDVFEMEDQRNWTDASFKIYPTPLSEPWPVAVSAGDAVTQSVDITLTSAGISDRPDSGAGAELTVGDTWLKLPAIGLCWPGGDAIEGQGVEWLGALSPDHLRVRVNDDDPAAALSLAAHAARRTGAALAADLVLDGRHNARLDAIDDRIGIDQVATWQLSGAGAACPDAMEFAATREWLMARGARQVGIGTQRFFTEFNRSRPRTDAADFAFFSVSPQVHSFDNASIMESLSAWPEMLRSARAVAGGVSLFVGPISLKPKQGPFGPGTPGIEDRHDWRQSTLFTAAWAVGLLAQLAGRAEQVTLFDVHGPGGVFAQGNGPSTLSGAAQSGRVFPVWHVLRDLGTAKGSCVRRIEGDERLGGLAWQTDGAWHIILANFTLETRPVSLKMPAQSGRASLRMLDGQSLGDVSDDPGSWRSHAETQPLTSGRLSVELHPYGCLFAHVSQ